MNLITLDIFIFNFSAWNYRQFVKFVYEFSRKNLPLKKEFLYLFKFVKSTNEADFSCDVQVQNGIKLEYISTESRARSSLEEKTNKDEELSWVRNFQVLELRKKIVLSKLNILIF